MQRTPKAPTPTKEPKEELERHTPALMSEWLRSWTRNPMGFPAQVRILFSATFLLIFHASPQF